MGVVPFLRTTKPAEKEARKGTGQKTGVRPPTSFVFPFLLFKQRLAWYVVRIQDTMRVILIKKHLQLPWARKQVYSSFLAQGKHISFFIMTALNVS